jgi:hypothetical protein
VSLSPLPAAAALDGYFLEARARLLDLAAILDRIDRGGEGGTVVDDQRIDRIRQALDVLADADGDRAEQIQMIFSRPYDPNWKRPTPR